MTEITQHRGLGFVRAKAAHTTKAVPVMKKDGSLIFHHKCIYLSLRGTHEYESNFPWPTADDAEHADCTHFDY